MHKDWCGCDCSWCDHPCSLDNSLYCSPDCEFLGKNGEMDSDACKVCDCYIAWKNDLRDLRGGE